MSEPIEIHDYSPEWAYLFGQLGARLRDALGPVALRIDHIGSTSIEGLAAKAVIDVQISVERLEPADPFRISLESIGFAWRRDNPELTKRYFRERPGDRRTHIHVRKAGSWGEQFALLFRDYLRLHPTDRGKYERVKRELAAKYREDRSSYTEAKGAIFWEIIRRASQWSQDTGWEPGASDA